MNAQTSMNSATPLLQIQGLDIRFRIDRKAAPFRAVKGISFDIPVNSTVALVGESGSGKSVSAMAILGLLPENAIIAPESRILYGGRDLLKASMGQMQDIRGKDISVIFQEPMTSLNPVFTVGEQIAEVLRLHMGMSMSQARARVVELLGEVGIPDPQLRVNSYPHEMSGGQQQRVMIAMAIACEPKLLIADEPTTALDVTIQKQILDLIAAAAGEAPHVGALHHPRPRRGGRDRRPRGGDAERRDPGAGTGARTSSRRRSTRTPRRCSPAARASTGGRSACR